MSHFAYKGGALHAEGVPVSQLAEEYGTPLYVYSHEALVSQFRKFDEAFAEVPHLICFAMKSNSNIAILRLFSEMGGGLDIVSGGELYRGVQAGVPSERVVFAGVGVSMIDVFNRVMRRLEPQRETAPTWGMFLVATVGSELFYFFELFQFAN